MPPGPLGLYSDRILLQNDLCLMMERCCQERMIITNLVSVALLIGIAVVIVIIAINKVISNIL